MMPHEVSDQPTVAGGTGLMSGLANFATGGGFGLAEGAINFLSQGQTNKANEMHALEQQNYLRESRDNAHQIEVKDLQAAGLNPILSAGGGGAHTGTPSMPTRTAPQISMPDYMQFGITTKQLEQADQKLQQDSTRISNETKMTTAQILEGLSRIDLNKIESMLKGLGVPKAKLGSNIYEGILGFGAKADKALDFTKRKADAMKNLDKQMKNKGVKQYNNFGEAFDSVKKWFNKQTPSTPPLGIRR